ncbi:HD domain-containing protein [Desulfosoma caldarium]|uniref:HD domain-containing protein n=1 Tax=Desulfosoma caldarium TaxID=610254 RepID=A0A3N1UQK8_9BACT|nr:HD domain-containing protein [Desulfosoma caldarium]ROQ93402.1 HD domain-containing protein [Desulfosoma caldarium]
MRCPGQDSRFWKPGAIFEAKCPQCGQSVEFFKDETSRKCARCGHKFVNPRMDFGCAAYCKFADQCLGDLPPELLAQRENLLKDRVAVEMKKNFGRDFKRIAHAGRVARYAEKLAVPVGADPAVVLIAALLHEVTPNGTPDPASTKAKELLFRLGARPDLVDEVCAVIDAIAHSSGQGSLNEQCLRDAHRLAELEEIVAKHPEEAEFQRETMSKDFLTETARSLAERLMRGEKV